MKKTVLSFLILAFTAHFTFAQVIQLEVNAAKSLTKIQPTMYGIFYEDINFAADGGLYAELIKNRGFEFENPMMGWQQPNSDKYGLNPNSGWASIIKQESNSSNVDFMGRHRHRPLRWIVPNWIESDYYRCCKSKQ